MSIALTDTPIFEKTRKSKKAHVLLATLLITIVMLAASHLHSASSNKPFQVRLYTNNIRYDNKNLTPGEQPWALRAPLVSESIVNHTNSGPAVVGLQEVLHNQLEDILGYLNKDVPQTWTYFGVGRTDGAKKGEFSPILYKVSEWHLKSSRTYWLSETPEKPSKGWDADLERVVSEVVLENKSSGKLVKVLNTHFDHKGVKARRESVKLIMSKMETGDFPSFLCGDLNTNPTDEPYAILKKSAYKDSRTYESNADENTPTFTGFSEVDGTGIIDYVWADSHAEWKGYRVLPNFFDFYMSDHRPVAADYVI